MDEQETSDLIKNCLSIILKTEIDEFAPDINLVDEGIFDSLDAMNFLFQIEKSLNRKIFHKIEVDQDLFELNKLVAFILNN